MKKLLLIILFIPFFLNAQYNNERSAEAGFEKSDLFFKSYYLNTFGLKYFQSVSIGLIDNPFLNIHLNPAIIPQFKDKNLLLYLDFRGDRTEEELINGYVPYDYFSRYNYAPYPSRRWVSLTRGEPEPLFSFGMLTNPLKKLTDNFYVGATYQFIKRQEKFYNNPYPIYLSSPYYDSFGAKAENADNVPIKDRFSGKDEMSTEGHMFALFAGYRLSENLSAGISFNGVYHNREGAYLSSGRDEYGNTDNSTWENRYGQSKKQDYKHSDFSAGIMYKVNSEFSLGIKAGLLSGKAEQNYFSDNYYYYNYDRTPVEDSRYKSYSLSGTTQYWKHDGNNKYASINFVYNISDQQSITGYYSYTRGVEDITNSSVIKDTSNFNGHYTYTNNNIIYTSDYSGLGSTSDIRFGTGQRNEYNHQASLNFKTSLTSNCKLSASLFLNMRTFDITCSEPVIASRYSQYSSSYSGNGNYNYSSLTSLRESKRLAWNYSADYFSIQIPVMIDFVISQYFGFSVGINRVMNNWKITEQTIAYFTYRKYNDNGVLKEETNFGERYTPADEKSTENETYLITRFNVNITPDFKINLLLDPKFNKIIQVPQWWLSFEAAF